jgi:hypothetical protein
MRITVLLVLLAAGISQASHSQPLFMKSDSTCEILNAAVITNWPSYSIQMPLDIVATYIVADTLCKLYSPEELYSFANSLSEDSIALGMRALLRALDYDYLRFRHTENESNWRQPAAYKSTYMDLGGSLQNAFYDRVSPRNLYDTLRDFNIGGVYLVNVESRSVHIDSTTRYFGSPHLNEIYCADISIITSIFGGLQNSDFCGNPIGEGSGNCIPVSWVCPPDSIFRYYAPKGFTYYESGPGKMEVGKQYIVFLDLFVVNTQADYTSYYLRVRGALPVLGNVVFDNDFLLRKGAQIDLEDCISTLRNGMLRLQ